MIIFVGDKPSAKNASPDVPFVGTKSYSTLLSWIDQMGLDISQIKLANQDGLELCAMDEDLMYNGLLLSVSCRDIFIALGQNASNTLKKLNISHFYLWHPSGLNRRLNDKKEVDKKLQECKTYIINHGG